jgi:membrane protein DedA with SNARE-associated domain
MSTGVTGASSWIEQPQGLRFPLAFIYGLSVAGAIGVLTPLPAVVAVVLAAQAVRRRVPHAGIALGVALIAAAIGTWFMFSNPFLSSRGDGL